ncbi:MAG: hypothetical protein COY46_01270 [Chloroflexi bacterium CG_4_10_14_0_8_um_filter_46_9]|nr:MAG: hypothetical protein COY46_01270 [Chloroflexi bacterium CG_4_10_14_0_8_um_filter_46_9]
MSEPSILPSSLHLLVMMVVWQWQAGFHRLLVAVWLVVFTIIMLALLITILLARHVRPALLFLNLLPLSIQKELAHLDKVLPR